MPNQTPIPPKPPVANSAEKSAQLRQAALEYHEFPTPGKISVSATKQLVNQHDLALAYSPGVAAPCEEIVKDPNNAYKYTSRGNLVAVITNGTAVLGLGDIGPLASKPVMEGKGAEGIQLYQTLQLRHVPSEFLVWPDEGHWVLKPQNSLEWHKAVLGWAEKWTKGDVGK